MSVVLTFLGRLHPVIVHLPIGIILLALFLQWLSKKKPGLKPAADLSLGLGVLAAIVSCCTGLLLSRSGDYDQDLVTTHLWLAISLTIVTGILYGQLNNKPPTRATNGLSIASLLLIFLTGHFGGSLTHGPGYLTTNLETKPQPPALQPVPDVQQAIVYTAMIQPVFHDNCYPCHRAGHVKGGLRLDDPEMIKKGGKDGPVLGANSLLIRRLELPLDDDHHMAPKEKPQLTAAEIKLVKWWVANGASFNAQTSQLPQDNDIHAVLAAFHDGTAGPTATPALPPNIADSDMPSGQIKPAAAEAIEAMRKAGALVLPIAANSPYLKISFPLDTIGKDALSMLPKLSEQIVELKCSGLPLGDEIVTIAANCPHLVRLWLDHTHITGQHLGDLQKLDALRYLNLTGTPVDETAVRTLTGAKRLRELYLYQTNVKKDEWPALKAAFPHTKLDSGGYQLTRLVSDTAIVRKAK